MMKIIDTQVEGGKIVGSIYEEDQFIKWFEETILTTYNMNMNNIKSILEELSEDIIKNNEEGTYFLIKYNNTYSFVIIEKQVRTGWLVSSKMNKHRVLGQWELINDIRAEKEYYEVLDFKTATKHTLQEIDLEKITMIMNCNNVEILQLFPNLRNLHFEDNSLQTRWFKKGDIPCTIETLSFPDCYKLNIGKNIIPNSVKSLTIGSHASCPYHGMIPEGVERLFFGTWFNHKMKPKSIPNSVLYMKFGKIFNQDLNGVLPPYLKELVIESNYKFNFKKEYIPETLEYIRINGITYKKGTGDFEKLLDKKMFDMTYDEIVKLLTN